MKSEHPATIYEVAQHAKVSTATVSRFLNGTARVSERTGKRITEAIDALQFHPNHLAQALKTARTYVIMLVVPDICNQFYAELYKNVQAIASRKGYEIMLHNTNESVEHEIRALELVRQRGYDGLIFYSVYYSAEMNARIRSLRIPVHQNITEENQKEYVPSIYLTTRHLIEYGHRDIVYVGGAPKTRINEMRRNGFMRAMDEAGLPYDQTQWFEMDFTMEAGYKAGIFLSALSRRPTAVCAANDQLAIGIMMALRETGIRVPEDISITGMDDVEYARLIDPPLTTIRNDPKPIAHNIMTRIFRQIDGIPEPANANTPEVTPPVIIRGSTRRLS